MRSKSGCAGSDAREMLWCWCDLDMSNVSTVMLQKKSQTEEMSRPIFFFNKFVEIISAFVIFWDEFSLDSGERINQAVVMRKLVWFTNHFLECWRFKGEDSLAVNGSLTPTASSSSIFSDLSGGSSPSLCQIFLRLWWVFFFWGEKWCSSISRGPDTTDGRKFSFWAAPF